VVLEEKVFLEINQSETRMGYVGHIFLTDPDKLKNLYRRTSIDASYQNVSSFGKVVSDRHRPFFFLIH
jgi:hypothetical protein